MSKFKNYFTPFRKEKAFIILVIIAGVIIVSTPYLVNFWSHKISSNSQDWGGFGSYVGGLLSPLLAIGSLYYVVKVFRQQSFENTFNLLLEQNNSLTEKILSGTSDNPSAVKNTLSYLTDNWFDSDSSVEKRSINSSYEINQYLRVAYQVLKFIDDNCPDDKSKYSRIFRSFLSNEVIYLIGLNCIQFEGASYLYPKYKYLVEQFGLLEHLHFDVQSNLMPSLKKPNIMILAERYNLSAFGDRSNISKALNSIIYSYKNTFKSQQGIHRQLLNDFKLFEYFKGEKYNKYIEMIEEYGSEDKAPLNELISLDTDSSEILNYSLGFKNGNKVPANYQSHIGKIKKNFEQQQKSITERFSANKLSLEKYINLLKYITFSNNFNSLIDGELMGELIEILNEFEKFEIEYSARV